MAKRSNESYERNEKTFQLKKKRFVYGSSKMVLPVARLLLNSILSKDMSLKLTREYDHLLVICVVKITGGEIIYYGI